MLEKISGIVIDVRKHSDRHNIITMFTRSRGRMSFLSPAGTGRSAASRYARLLPLSVVETDVNVRMSRDLQKLGAVTPAAVWTNLYSNPAKQAIALFLSEFLNRLLKESAPDERMWDFIFDSIRLLDASSTGIANFHIAFLISLMPYAGIFPDISDYEEGDCFDMRSATFTPIRPVHNDFLQGNDAKGVTLFCRISYYNSRHFRLRPEERMYALRRILRYYSIHFPGVGQLRSIDVLHEIFSS